MVECLLIKTNDSGKHNSSNNNDTNSEKNNGNDNYDGNGCNTKNDKHVLNLM